MKDNNYEVIFVKNSNEFIGLKGRHGRLEFYVPAVFRRSESQDDEKRTLIRFLDSLKYSGSKESGLLDDDIYGEKISKIWPISSFLWIIRDYLENGYYYNREKVFRRDSRGKISWKKTLKTTPVISDGNIVYTKLVTSLMSSTNDIVAQIYKLCLRYSFERVGWVFNLYESIDVQQLKTKEEMSYIISTELSKTFDDVKRQRFKHMLKIIDNVNDQDSMINDSFDYGVKNYYHVYEKMIDKAFKGISEKELKRYFPSGHWMFNGATREVSASSSLYPDTIYKRKIIDKESNEEKNEIFIFDSKMYKFGLSRSIVDLPATDSIQKQITYGDYVKFTVDKNSKVRNAFVLPFNKQTFKYRKDDLKVSDNLCYIGYAFADWQNDERDEDHDYIYLFMIDFNYLLMNYDKKNNDVDLICDLIDELLEAQRINKR